MRVTVSLTGWEQLTKQKAGALAGLCWKAN